MKWSAHITLRILAIDPFPKGLGFVVLEGPEQLLNWGTKTAKGDRNADCLRLADELMSVYRPDVIALEDHCGEGSRRHPRVQTLIQNLLVLASSREIATRTFSRLVVIKALAEYGARTKHQIAVHIARRFPELEPHLPARRKPWDSESERMSIFDAASLALTLFDSNESTLGYP